MATGTMLRAALESQDHGFICLHGETDKDRLLPVVIFKRGDNLFAVNLVEAFECTFESIESGLPDGNYLDSYGGNNMELMRQSLGRDLSRSSIDSPGTFMSTTVGLAAQEFDR